jgi:hypothetical protein
MGSDLEQQPVAAKGVDCLSAIGLSISTTQTLCLSSAFIRQKLDRASELLPFKREQDLPRLARRFQRRPNRTDYQKTCVEYSDGLSEILAPLNRIGNPIPNKLSVSACRDHDVLSRYLVVDTVHATTISRS